MASVAIVGMACRYPDARSPTELWENALAQRRAFRRIPDERLRLADYLSDDRSAPDRTYSQFAAVIEGYEFDRVRFRVSGPTFRSVDLTHWLALDVSAAAVADAGFPDGEGLPRDTTGVFLGNTLAGEFSRANVMRLRWPYVRRVVESGLVERKWSEVERLQFLDALEEQYKSAFPPVSEETLAGGMSNTIAGRISNHFDLKGGGYTVDAACASSLLAAANACAALEAGDLDVALAGGVDLSLDPFELVGFAKVGALAAEKMRIFDERSAGFWPGEGCGIVVLMRTEDAIHQQKRIYATIRGWGVSSDGSGGITRPEVEGQLLALRRAYRRAGFGIDTVGYFEAHGTGTAVGDATELTVVTRARQEANPTAPPAVLSGIKANIGHTKAAAGVAGLIKAAMSLDQGILPPITGCDHPHPQLREPDTPSLRLLKRGERWPQNQPRRAAVSAMGFGGINTHVVLEGVGSPAPGKISAPGQDAEIFLFAANDRFELLKRVEHLSTFAARISEADLTDLAAEMARRLGDGRCRSAIVATCPQQLRDRLTVLAGLLRTDSTAENNAASGVFFAEPRDEPRIGFLFPGQGSPVHLSGGVWRDRFEYLDDLYDGRKFSRDLDTRSTEIAQPAIMRATLAGLRLLDRLGVQAAVGLGHSLGELAALYWAGALDEQSLLRIAVARGKAMQSLGGSAGAMATIFANLAQVQELVNGYPVVIAGFNSLSQTVISGEADAVRAAVQRARARGVKIANLPVSHAFHSPLVAAAAPILAKHLQREEFRPLRRQMISSVTGSALTPTDDLRALICDQVTLPVRFHEAFEKAERAVDLWIEAGPGAILSSLIKETARAPAIALDAGGPSIEGLLHAVGAAFVLGTPIQHEALFEGRLTRPFDLDWHPVFFSNPCENAPVFVSPAVAIRPRAFDAEPEKPASVESSASALEIVRELVARRTELPLADVKENFRLLSDLHLNSIIVGQIVTEASRRLGAPQPLAPTQYADTRISDIAQALEESARCGVDVSGSDVQKIPPGVDDWVRCFRVDLVEKSLAPHAGLAGRGAWKIFGDGSAEQIEPFRRAFAAGANSGVAVILPPVLETRQPHLLLDAARQVLQSPDGKRFVIVEQGGGGGAFARTLCLEAPDITCCVVNVPAGHPQAPEWAVQEAVAASGFTEAHYDRAGVRRVPVLKLLPWEQSALSRNALTPEDVLLVTGGGKGIAAECALDLARATGVRLALVGRSSAAIDPDLRANLERFAASGIGFRYFSADVSDLGSVRATVQEAEAALGPITGILHAAGANVPQLIGALDSQALTRTLSPKITGLNNLLEVIDPDRLRWLVTFGSLIARTGLSGEADYGLANEWLRVMVECWRDHHPSCRCLHLDWSVWSGAGMGERLGRMELLMQRGITPIPVDQGIHVLRELLKRDVQETSIVVTGRFGEPPTLASESGEMPFRRFIEKVRTYVRGVEIIAEAELSVESDPYLNEHIFDGQRILPAVIGLEAMAQIAMWLLETESPPNFEDVSFDRAIAVPDRGSIKIRVAALVYEPGRCRVVLRSSETIFQVDHFRATCRIAEPTITVPRPKEMVWVQDSTNTIPLDPRRDLYGRLLFHSGRFCRLGNYHRLRAKECVAEITPSIPQSWFWRYLPADLTLGDPAARDAAVHAIQACIPQATLLPTGVARIVTSRLPDSAPLFVHAKEYKQTGDTFIYDLEIASANGTVVEQWRGLRLQRVRDANAIGDLAAPLLAPYLERRVHEVIPEWTAAIVIEQDHQNSERAFQKAIGFSEQILRRPDGKPEVAAGKWQVSASHSGDLLLAVAGRERISCDAEVVSARTPTVWRDLLGAERYALAELIATSEAMTFDTAATHVWTASECLIKAGVAPDAPLTLQQCIGKGSVLFSCGARKIATLEVSSRATSRVFAFLMSIQDTTCAPTNTATSSVLRRRISSATSIM